MANMVTRTIRTTKVFVIGADLNENKVVNYEVILPRVYKDEKAILRELNKRTADDASVKPVSISRYEIQDTLYGMPEDDFIANAKVLPPRKDYTKNDENN